MLKVAWDDRNRLRSQGIKDIKPNDAEHFLRVKRCKCFFISKYTHFMPPPTLTQSHLKIHFQYLSHNDCLVIREFIERNLQVKRSRSLPYSSWSIIVGAMARTVVASEVSGVGDGHTTQMGAHAKDNDPAGVNHSILVMLGVPQLPEIHRRLCGDFLLCAVPDKQGLSPPLEGHVFAFGDVTELDLNLG